MPEKRIKFYVVSCSSDTERDARKLYVWGEMGDVTWLPETKGEARKRIEKCKKRTGCGFCDAEIHMVIVNRMLPTFLSYFPKTLKTIEITKSF